MGLPEQVCILSASCDQLIVDIVLTADFERWSLSQNHEQNNSCSKDINSFSIILFSFVDFRGHIGDCSKLSLKKTTSVSSLSWSCKSKICNLNIVILVEHDVFRLEITMADASVMAVFESLHHLAEEESCSVFTEGSSQSNEVEKFSSLGKLKHNVSDLLGSFLWVTLSTFCLFVKLDNVGVIESS